MLPQLAKGEANKIFVIPSEFTQALGEHRRRRRAAGAGAPTAAAAEPRR